MSEYNKETTYLIKNISNKTLKLISFSVLINFEESGYYVKGWHTASLNGEVVTQKTRADDPNGFQGGDSHTYDGSLEGVILGIGETLTLDVEVTFYTPLGDWKVNTSGMQVESSDPEMEGRLSVAVTVYTPPIIDSGGDPSGPSGGGVSGAGEASPQGTTYTITPSLGVAARVTRWAYPPLFGVKRLVPPPPPPPLYYPTTWGPILEGEIDGLFITPGIIAGVKLEDGTVTDIEASGTRFRLSSPENGSTVRFGIMPFKEGGA